MSGSVLDQCVQVVCEYHDVSGRGGSTDYPVATPETKLDALSTLTDRFNGWHVHANNYAPLCETGASDAVHEDEQGIATARPANGGEMNRVRRGRFGVSGVVALVVLSGCAGGEDDKAGAGETGAPPGVAAGPSSSPTTNCSDFPRELILEVGRGYQMVAQLEPTRTLEAMEETGAVPDPAAFRSFGEAFAHFDTAGIREAPFQAPDLTGPGQVRLAELLEAALSERDDPQDPAWAEFRAFVDENATRQQLSMNYHMSEAGCV